MRSAIVVPTLLCIVGFLHAVCSAQDATRTNAIASSALLHSANALRSGNSISDVTLSGSVIWFLSSEHRTGTVTMQARGTSESRVAFSLEDDSRVEVHGNIGSAPVCYWSGSDGVHHEIAVHNCLTDAAWFFPALFAFTDFTAAVKTNDLGEFSKDGLLARHVRTWRNTTRGTKAALAAFARLSTVEYYLDRQSFLPIVARFNVHPDDDAERDIPVEIRFADYRSVQGVQVPFRIQKFMDGTLLLDITIVDAALNTGLPDSTFSAN